MTGNIWEKIPKGYEKDAFFERILSAKYCTYDKFIDGTLSIEDVFAMHSKLDLRDYRELMANRRMQQESQKKANKKNDRR